MSGTASSPNKFSSRLSPRPDLSPMRSVPAPQYLHELDVSATQRQHATALTVWQDRLHRQEENADSIIDALKGQIALLRKQLEANDASHRREVESIRKEKETREQQLQLTIHTLEAQLSQQTSLRMECEAELGGLQGAVRRAQNELDTLRTSRTTMSQAETQRLMERNQELSDLHRINLENNRRLQQEIAAFNRELEVKDSAISDLRETVNLLKEENSVESLEKEEEMRKVKREFGELQRALKAQRSEYERVSTMQAHWEREWRDWQQEQELRESESRRLRHENNELQQQVARLEKLVYGRGSRGTPSPARSRTPLV